MGAFRGGREEDRVLRLAHRRLHFPEVLNNPGWGHGLSPWDRYSIRGMDLDEALRVLASLAREGIEYEGVKVRIATPRTLYWMKKGTVREIDHSDAARLKEKFKLADDDFDPSKGPHADSKVP